MIQQLGLVAVGGAIGAVLRYAIGHTIAGGEFPWSTFMVNVIGSFALGLLSVMAINNLVSKDATLFLGVGLLGAFTTMSTFSIETVGLLKNDQYTLALAYSSLSFILCIIGAFVGWELGDRLQIN